MHTPLQILDIICSYYQFHVKMLSTGGLIFTTAFGDTVNAVQQRSTSEMLTCFSFESKEAMIQFVLSAATDFEIFVPRYALTKNIFFGCKTLEEVLIVKDLNSHKNLEILTC